jgi:hypothetical protein
LAPESLSALIVSIAAFGLSLRAFLVDEKRKRVITAIEQNDKLTSTLTTMHNDLCSRANAGGLSEALADDAKLFANRLETWALYINRGMAEEQILFEVSGTSYCGLATGLARLANLSDADVRGSWPPIYLLADRWKGAMQAGRLPKKSLSTRARRLLRFVTL